MATGEFVSVTDGEEFPRVYLAQPDDGGTHPGLIMIMEAGGVNEPMQAIARQIADEGFIVAAPDLYRGKVATDWEGMRPLMEALDQEQGLSDIDAAVEFLKGQNVTLQRFGVTGFCMGGRYTWWSAMRRDDYACIAPFYAGRFNPEPEELEKVSAPALIMWGSKDASTPAEHREHIVNTLTEQGKFFKAVSYPAGHAFMTEGGANYDEAATRDAFPTLISWFRTYLR